MQTAGVRKLPPRPRRQLGLYFTCGCTGRSPLCRTWRTWHHRRRRAHRRRKPEPRRPSSARCPFRSRRGRLPSVQGLLSGRVLRVDLADPRPRPGRRCRARRRDPDGRSGLSRPAALADRPGPGAHFPFVAARHCERGNDDGHAQEISHRHSSASHPCNKRDPADKREPGARGGRAPLRLRDSLLQGI